MNSKSAIDPLKQVGLDTLMNETSGNSQVTIGLIDGPVNFAHPAFQRSNIRTVKDSQFGKCKSVNSLACLHGTFITGILCARRGLSAPAICPDCKLLLYPIFREIEEQASNSKNNINTSLIPSSTAEELSNAIIQTVDAEANIINISAGLSTSSLVAYKELEEAYDYAMRHGVIIVAAGGNQGNIGYRSLLNHHWIIPVAACDEQGRLDPMSNFGLSIGSRGLMAPGVNIRSTLSDGGFTQMSGTSFAAPFVTGAMALLWSIFPKIKAAEMIRSITGTAQHRAIIPPLLDAASVYQNLKNQT